jgi:hypothetical protein
MRLEDAMRRLTRRGRFPGACSRDLQIAVSRLSALPWRGAISRPPRSGDRGYMAAPGNPPRLRA